MKSPTPIKIIAGLFAIVLLVAACAATHPDQADPNKINYTVKQLKRVRFNKYEDYLVLALTDEMEKPDRSKIDDATIDNIASLLATPYYSLQANSGIASQKKKTTPRHLTGNTWFDFDMEDEIRRAAAAALGAMGARAERAIPALDEALTEIRDVEQKFVWQRTTDSGDFICNAFYKIGGEEELNRHDCKSAAIDRAVAKP